MYGLADCNNFFVSCERAFNPSLVGKPVIVLSNNDGCIISRSNEAKALGIKMGQPVFEVKNIVKEYDVKIFSSNYILYGDMSARVMESLRTFVPNIEVYSIDEAFLDFSGINEGSLVQLGLDIAAKTKQFTGIPVSLGISHTKTLAKIASKLCKLYPKLNNSCLMVNEKDIIKVLKKFPIEEVWGIGRRYSKMLKSKDIVTAYDFAQQSAEWVRSKMSIVGLKTWKELNGEPCISFEDTANDKQQICTSRSFSKGTSDIEELYKSIAYFTSLSAEKLRAQKCVCGAIQIFILTSAFREDIPKYYNSVIVPLENHTDSTLELVKTACFSLSKIFRPNFIYKKAGIILMDISRKDQTSASLFCEIDLNKHSKLMHTMDEINNIYGKSSIVTAAQGIEGFKSNREFLSQRYTTSWDDIINVIV